MFKRLILFALIVVSLLVFSSNALAENNWDIKIDLSKHNIVLKTGQKQGTYDNQSFKTVAPIKKNGNIYIPVQLIQDLKLANVENLRKINQVKINLAESKYSWGSDTVKFKFGSPVAYFIDKQGKEYRKTTIPKPFIYKNNFYIPLSAFKAIFYKVDVSLKNNSIILKFNDVIINTKNVPEQTDSEFIDLNVIYDKQLYLPQIGGEYAMTKNSSMPDLVENGKVFKAFTSRLPLKPGENSFMVIEEKAFTQKFFSILKPVPSGAVVPIEYFEAPFLGKMSSSFFQITNPQKGYLELSSPANLVFKALIQENIGDNIFSLNIRKLVDDHFQNYKELKMPISKEQISVGILLPEKGYYLIEVISPKYISPSGGSSSTELAKTKWAEFRVTVK